MAEDRRSLPIALGATAVLFALTVLLLARFAPARLLLEECATAAAGAAVVLLAAMGAGRLAGFDRWSDQLAIGFAAIGTLAAAAALVDVRIGIALTIAISVYGVFSTSHLWGAHSEDSTNHESISGRAAAPAIPPLLLVPIFIALLMALAPVNSPDELVYKLSVPKAWLQAGRMFEMPLNSNSYLAMALQSADVTALAIGGGIAAKLAHFGLYCAALAIARRVGGELAAAALAWTPALAIIAGWAWNEWGVIALLLLSWEAWTRDEWRKSSIALGCAAAIKYTALPWIAVFAILVAWKRRDVAIRMALLVAAFGGFFYIRNLIWTGSPVAPLLLPNAPAVSSYRGNGWIGLIEGKDLFDADVADESLGIVVPLLALAGMVAWRSRPELAWLGLAQMPVLLTIAPGSRNIINGVVPLVVAGALWLEERVAGDRVFRGVLVVAMLLPSVVIAFTLSSFDVGPYLAGKETALQYIDRTRAFSRPYAWIRSHTPVDARVLLLGENRTYYLGRPWAAGGNLDGPRVAAWLGQFTAGDALHDELLRQHISCIVIHLPWYRVGAAPLSPIEKESVLEVPPATHAALMRYLSTHAARVYRDSEYIIYSCR